MNVVPAIIIMAKEPLPGRVKTRLSPPLSLAEAAAVAAAALADTIDSVLAVTEARAVLALEGGCGPWVPAGIEAIPQRGEGFDERLANAFDDVGGPALAIAADTPQLTPRLLEICLDALSSDGVDAVLGRADDGGYWVIGLRTADPRVFLGVPMSRPVTADAQLTRLGDLGLNVVMVNPMRDVDTINDAVAVAADIPESRFARVLAATSAMAIAP